MIRLRAVGDIVEFGRVAQAAPPGEWHNKVLPAQHWRNIPEEVMQDYNVAAY
mgnify:FL=1